MIDIDKVQDLLDVEYGYEGMDVDLSNIPTIDAIPVRFIEKLSWKYSHDENVRNREPEWSNALDSLIDEWRKEGEN